MTDTRIAKSLLERPPRAVNLGLAEFARTLEAQGVKVVAVDWSPPRQRDPKLDALLRDLL